MNKEKELKLALKNNSSLCAKIIELTEANEYLFEKLEIMKKRNRYLERKNTELTKMIKKQDT